MALRGPGGRITHEFGPSALGVEPQAWAHFRENGRRKAYWVAFPGAHYERHMHMGVDFGGRNEGAPLYAMERGTVIRSEYDRYNGGGHVVEVQIRPGVSYSFNHCSVRKVRVGDIVNRGQVIALVGCTGTIWTGTMFVPSCFGNHCHVNLTIRERGSDGITRNLLYDVADFLKGGALEDDSRIKPL